MRVKVSLRLMILAGGLTPTSSCIFYNKDHSPKDPVQLLLKNAKEVQMKMHPEN